MNPELFQSTSTTSPILRGLIVTEIVVSLIGTTVSSFDPQLLPPPLRDYRASTSSPAFTIASGIALIGWCVCFILLVAGLVMLWRGRPSGLSLYLSSWLLLIVLAFFGGPVVTSAPSTAFVTLLTLIGGIIIGFVLAQRTSTPNAAGSV